MATSTKALPKKGISLVSSDKISLAPLSSIDIVERPAPGKETGTLFFNPRFPDSFDPESMTSLRESIQVDGLKTPLLVRAIQDGKRVVKLQLIAGERRKRSLDWLVEHDVPCYSPDLQSPQKFKANDWVIFNSKISQVTKCGKEGDYEVSITQNGKTESHVAKHDDLLPTLPASKVYAQAMCNVIYNCSDKLALRLSVIENGSHKALTVKEEIALVERLTAQGLKQDEICEIMHQNVTWVSQTGTFRKDLPTEAFQKLLDGKMLRNVAVNILSYAPSDRQSLYEATVKAEEADRQKAVATWQGQQEHHEDAEELALAHKKRAEKEGDSTAAKRAGRKAESESVKAKKAADKKARVEKEAGMLRQGHVQKGAAAEGLKPKKAKLLPKQEIEQLYVDKVKVWEKSGHIDSMTGHKLPAEHLMLVRYTAMAILQGERDPTKVVRSFMVKTGQWELESQEEEEEEDDRAPKDEDLDALNDDSDYDEDAALADELGDRIEEEDLI